MLKRNRPLSRDLKIMTPKSQGCTGWLYPTSHLYHYIDFAALYNYIIIIIIMIIKTTTNAEIAKLALFKTSYRKINFKT